MKPWMLVVLMGLASAVTVAAQPEREARVPPKQWFDGERGYEKAKELQEQTGADILLYFFRYDKSDEKGLCRWWETKGLQHGHVSKFLRDYIKVKVQMPLKKREEETFAAYKFNKTPAVFVVTPSGRFPARIQVFDWPNNRPELKQASELIDAITKVSTPKAEPPAE